MKNKICVDYNNKVIEYQVKFDEVYIGWMQKLIKFIKKTGHKQGLYVMQPELCVNLQKKEYEFYKLSTSVSSQFFYFLTKDALSQVTENFALESLCEHISSSPSDKECISTRLKYDNDNIKICKESEYTINLNYMRDLVNNQRCIILQSEIYDFYVGMWSGFEASINSLKETENTNENKVNHGYITFSNRIRQLFSIIKSCYNSNRNIDNDKETLFFLAAMRNTIHNNGVYMSKNKKIVVKGQVFELMEGQEMHFNDYQDIMNLVNELFDIYHEIMICITRIRFNNMQVSSSIPVENL